MENGAQWPENRGVEDIFIACTGNLTGFDAVIPTTFPQAEIQNCIIHQLRNSSKYMSFKNLKAFMADLKAACAAVEEQAVLDAMGHLWRLLGQEIPENLPALEGQLGQSQHLF